MHVLKFANLFYQGVASGFWHCERSKLLLKFQYFVGAVISKFFLNVANFLLKEVFALLLVKVFSCLSLNVGFKSCELYLSVEDC